MLKLLVRFLFVNVGQFSDLLMGIFLNLLNKLVCLRLDGLAVINILLSPNIAPLIDGTLDMADEVLTGPHLLIDNLDYIFLNLNQRYEGMTRVNMGDNAF